MDARTINWDDKIAAAQLALLIIAADSQTVSELGDLVAEWRTALGRLEREQQHLADELKRLGLGGGGKSNTGLGRSRDINSRPTVAPSPRARGQPNRVRSPGFPST
jgi:hypothetical protein